MRLAAICAAPPAMPVRLPPGRARSVTTPAATGFPTSVKTIGICWDGVLGGERGRFVVREDQVHVRLDQRPRLRRQLVALAFGEVQLEGHVATFGKAPGAQAGLQALDGRMIGGPGLVQDPDAISGEAARLAQTILPAWQPPPARSRHAAGARTRRGLAALTPCPLFPGHS